MPQLRNTLALLILLLSSCHYQSRIEGVFELVENQPDSALQILNGIDRNTLSTQEQAEWGLAFTWAQSRKGVFIDNDSVIRIAYDYYRHWEPSLRKSRCMYYMGLCFMETDSTELTKECMAEAIAIARSSGDTKTECMASERLSRVFLYAGETDSASHYARRAREQYETLPHTEPDNMVYYLVNDAMCTAYSGNISGGLQLCRKALNIAFSENNDELASNAYQHISSIYDIAGRPDSSLHYIKKAKQLVSRTKHNSLLFTLVDIYLQCDSTAQAVQILNEIELASDLDRYSKFYQLTMASLKKLGADTIAQYAKSAFQIVESMYHSQMQSKETYYKDKIQAEIDRSQAERRASRQALLLVLAACAILALATSGYTFYRYRLKLHRQQLRHVQQLRDKEVEHKDIQLATMRDFLTKKVEIVARLTDKPADLSPLTDEDWQEIETFLEAVDNLFVTRLRQRHPDLKPKDVRLFMLLRLKVPSKSLALIYGISEKSIRQNLFLAKTKVGLTDKDPSLREYIDTFDDLEK